MTTDTDATADAIAEATPTEADIAEVIRCCVTFDDPDYADLFSVARPAGDTGSPEEWARTILEEGEIARQHARRLWRLMGMRLGPPAGTSPDHVQGWKIGAAGDRWIRLELASWYLSAQAVVLVDDDQVSLSVSVRHDRPLVAKPVWRLIESPHRRAVPAMLHQAAALRSQAQPQPEAESA
jgi:hypothetical protein